MGMEWCNSYHYVSAIFIEPFQAGIKICTRIRTEESVGVNEAFSLRWFSLCLFLIVLHSVYCAVILALIETSMNYVPETLIFRCSNLFQMAKSTLLTGYVGRSRMQMNSCYISTTLLGSICGTFKATYWSPVFLDGNQVMLILNDTHSLCSHTVFASKFMARM